MTRVASCMVGSLPMSAVTPTSTLHRERPVPCLEREINRPEWSRRLPERANRDSEQSVAEGDRRGSIMENDTRYETLAGHISQFAKSAEVTVVDARRRLHFDPDDSRWSALQHDVHLEVIAVPEMEET